MADFGKINPEKAQAIIKALKDGKINEQEMKKLGLSPEEAKALNEAFASGAAEVGDFVLFNKGQITKDGKKMQLTSTGKKVKNNKQENEGFLAKAGKFLLSLEKYAMLPTPLLFMSCSGKDDITNYEFVNQNTNNIRVTVTAELSSLEAMINKLIEKMPDLSVLQELLKEVQALRKDENANSKDTQVILIRILAAIGDNQKALEIIINEIGDNNDLIKVVIDKLTEGNQTLSDIRDLLKQNNTDNKVIMQLLARIQTLLKNNNKISLDIYNMIKNIDPKDYTAQLNKIIELLEQLDKNNDVRTANVIAAINKLGDDVAGDLAAILEAIQKLPASKQKDYTEILNAILDKIKEGNAQDDANFKAVLDKIKDLGVSVAYGMNAILDAIKGMPNYNAKLDAILAKMDALEGKVTKNGNTLVDILNAIKDLKNTINIVIEGDKIKVICNCGNCGGNKHEGIIGDLEELLN